MNESSTPANSASQNQMAEPPIVPLCLCKSCGAITPKPGHSHRNSGTRAVPEASLCWMCGAQPNIANPYATQTIGSDSVTQAGAEPPILEPLVAQNSKYDSVFLTLIGVCLILAILVGIGISIDSPGTLVIYLLLIIPPFTITGVRALYQKSSVGRTNPQALLINLVVSFVFSVAIVVVLAVAAVVVFFLFCLSLLSGMH